MNKDVDKLLEVAGDRGKYQMCILALAFGFWVTLDVLSISLPYLEKTSTVQILDKSQNIHKNVSLNYTICENKQLLNNSRVVERSGHSWVIEFNIECDKMRTGLIGSFTFAGVLVGSILFQFLPDSIGRRNTVIIGGTGFSLLLLCFNFIPSYNYLLLFSFLIQIFGYLGILTVFMMSNEITAIELRSTFGAIINSAFSASGVFYITLFYYLDDWRLCFTFASFFNFIVVLIFCKVGLESPRYYSCRGENRNMMKSVTSIAMFNGNLENLKNETKDLPNLSNGEHSLDKVAEGDEIDSLKSKTKNDDKSQSQKDELMSQNSVISLFKYSSIRRTFLVNCYLWFSTSGIYYGLSIYLKNLPGDLYVNGIFIYVSEVFSYVISGWIINIPSIGRKGSMMIFESVSLLGYMTLLMFNFENYYKTLFSFVARFAISGVYNIIYTYSAEVYPTVVRAKGFGFNSICARLGGIIFPLMIELFDSHVIYVFTFLNFLALMLVFMLPETYGKPLEDRIKEADREIK